MSRAPLARSTASTHVHSLALAASGSSGRTRHFICAAAGQWSFAADVEEARPARTAAVLTSVRACLVSFTTFFGVTGTAPLWFDTSLTVPDSICLSLGSYTVRRTRLVAVWCVCLWAQGATYSLSAEPRPTPYHVRRSASSDIRRRKERGVRSPERVCRREPTVPRVRLASLQPLLALLALAVRGLLSF